MKCNDFMLIKKKHMFYFFWQDVTNTCWLSKKYQFCVKKTLIFFLINWMHKYQDNIIIFFLRSQNEIYKYKEANSPLSIRCAKKLQQCYRGNNANERKRNTEHQSMPKQNNGS
jgi:hypothetical protein